MGSVKKMGSDIADKTILITGCTSGVGLETAKALARRGATVIFAVRNSKKAAEIVDQIKKKHPDTKLLIPKQPLDLASQDSIQRFTDEINSEYRQLDVLINNAGISHVEEPYTKEGIGALAQVNFLGPYILTRLLETKLVASHARVVTVSSISHRMATIKDEKAFLMDRKCGQYRATKLASVLFAYELQRRLGPHGVTSVCVDPGCVRTNIFSYHPQLNGRIFKSVINACFSPPCDGCLPVLHAATVPWQQEGSPESPDLDLRYFSRGLFNHPLLVYLDGIFGKDASVVQNASAALWGPTASTCALMDWPLRKMLCGLVLSKTKCVRSSSLSYDEGLAQRLWNLSSELAHLPAFPLSQQAAS